MTMRTMRARWGWPTLGAALVLAISSVPGARGDFIAGNLGPGGSFDASGGYTLSGPDSATGFGYELAVEFAITSPTPTVFGSASVALWYHSGTNAVDLSLLADLDGVPGSVLETIHLTDIPDTPALVTANSTGRTLLDPGTHYWIALTASPDGYFSWMGNDRGQTGHLAYRTDFGVGPGAWLTVAAVDPAFAVATMAVPAAAVPTPGSHILLGSGLIGLVAIRTRRDRGRGRGCGHAGPTDAAR